MVLNWPLKIQGRFLSQADVDEIRMLLREQPSWNRSRLSRELCVRWYWKRPDGQIKDMACRELLRKLETHSLIKVVYHTHALTGTFSEDEILFWQNLAQEMVVKFHRASSAVEGRNGFLTQIYHNHRGLSPNRLKALTVLHNFFITCADGSTAAERLFGEKPPDLLEWLLHRMGELPLPRKSRKRVKSNPLNLLSVPA